MKPVLLVAALPFFVNASATQCVEIGGASVRGTTGWNHIVYLTNRCETPVVCDVSTDVDPDVQHASVALNQTVQVMTAQSSPSRVFVPSVDCSSITDSQRQSTKR